MARMTNHRVKWQAFSWSVLLGLGLASAHAAPPDWAADAVWYQVLVSRFCNGAPANDPPRTQPWTDDWARLMPGEEPPLYRRLFYRQYGGDLQGLRIRLPYLESLGVNTVYLNPIFVAPSEHKYDTADHRHIDATYSLGAGPDEGADETADPTTWRWRPGDRYFLDLVAEMHRRGMRVVLDGVFNHVGREFWAFKDVLARGEASPFARWFDVTDWGPPLQYQAWDGPNGSMPRFRRSGDGLDPDVEAYLFAVTRRWLDPNGDGDPSDGVDGWRLDAAEQVPHGFWRRFRRVVKQANPQAIILGEIWIDAGDWLGGDKFDIVTNYRFCTPVIEFLRSGRSRLPATGCVDALRGLHDQYPRATTLAMANLLDSHDTERIVTMLADPTSRAAQGDGEVPRRDLLTPVPEDYARQMLAVLVQFTWPGAPMVYYGDEVGMSGGDDPFCRAPMRWDLTESEQGTGRLVSIYRALARLRTEHVELRRGECRVLYADDVAGVVAFERFLGRRRTIAIVNAGTERQVVRINTGLTRFDGVQMLDSKGWHAGGEVATSDGMLRVAVGPLAAIVCWGEATR
ncbi:MAG TPA: glycoside hydrolase family 13 protein [Phycisphaerae bacterium]|nr:glycoside hydrolase family 13 protein [Phycisphaerae bacterium]